MLPLGFEYNYLPLRQSIVNPSGLGVAVGRNDEGRDAFPQRLFGRKAEMRVNSLFRRTMRSSVSRMLMASGAHSINCSR